MNKILLIALTLAISSIASADFVCHNVAHFEITTKGNELNCHLKLTYDVTPKGIRKANLEVMDTEECKSFKIYTMKNFPSWPNMVVEWNDINPEDVDSNSSRCSADINFKFTNKPGDGCPFAVTAYLVDKTDPNLEYIIHTNHTKISKIQK